MQYFSCFSVFMLNMYYNSLGFRRFWLREYVCVMLVTTGFHLYKAEGRAAHISLLCAETIAAFV